MHWDTWLGTLIAVGIGLIGYAALLIVLKVTASRAVGRNRWWAVLVDRLHPRIQLLVALVILWVAGGLTAPATYPWWYPIGHVFLILTVLAGAWLLSGLVSFGIDRLMRRLPATGANLPEGRRMRTQLTVIRRLAIVLIVVVALGVVLFSFPMVRAVGTSVLASAGVISVIAGLAAQSTLGNLFAGIQLAFSDSIRVGDVVVVEGEWGTVGEITLTYVVVYVWDERRLILPCTYFATKPFENWTRKSAKILGTVYMDLDWRVPIAEVREYFDSLLAQTELWDGRVSSVLVTGAEGGMVTVRFLVSSEDSSQQWALRCLIREEMITWLQQNHPEALPTSRVILTNPKEA